MTIAISRNFRVLLCLIISLQFAFLSYTLCQGDEISQKRISISKTNQVIALDGKLDESDWSKAQVVSDFRMHAPVDNKPASLKTEVKMLYDDKFIYVSAVCYDDSNFTIQTLKRDDFGNSDEFAVVFDPVNQQANGFGFGVNAFGAETEAAVFGDNGDTSWDNKWFSATGRYDGYWVVEMAIPLKSLRFESGKKEWGINFVRVEPSKNEIYTWAPVPRQFDFIDLGYLGTLSWSNPPKKSGSNISIIPYSTIRINKNFDTQEDTKVEFDVGGDIKIALSPSLNLDLTFNPDFSQAEVDDQVTNLTRFSIFFPEKRQFFLENSDIFNGFGQFANGPFYSRRIGLDAFGRSVPILYGARLSGNLNEKLRIGLLNMHTASNEERLGQNYSAFVFQHRLWSRSAIKGIFLNRQAFDGSEQMDGDYGRNGGIEFDYSTADGKVQGQLGYLHSFKDEIDDNNSHRYLRFDYNGTNFRTFLGVQNIGRNYYSDIGFDGRINNYNPETGEVVRIGYTQISNMLNYYIYPKESDKVNTHWSGIENFVYINEGGDLNEWYLRLRHFIFYKNTSQLRFRLNYNYVDLVFPFALTDPPLPVDQYHMTEFNVQFNTDIRKELNTEMFVVYGQFYGGTKLTYRGALGLRKQPWGNFTIGIEQNNIWLPDPHGNLKITLATLRSEISFSKDLFLTTYLQYNTQFNNFNMYNRFQWRFAPMADLFLVYTDNYLVEDMIGPKDRSIILKANYWLSL